MPASPAVLRFTKGLPPTRQYGERLRLLVREGRDKGTCYSLLGDVVFIGREGCQIVLNDSNISRRHAELSWRRDHYVLRDLGSANGILHNGTKASEAKLSPGDLLLMGLTMVEVYPPGQTRKNERPMLPAPVSAQAAAAGPSTPKEEREERRKVERKRMTIFALVFFVLALAYFNDEGATMREHTRIRQAEDVPEPGEKTGLSDDKSKKKIDGLTKQIQETKMKLVRFQEEKSKMEERAKTMKNLSAEALLERGEPADKAQRKDSDSFFRSGVRELQNRNYRRAFTAFETALTVDPSNELAKIYLKSAQMELLSELWSSQVAGLRAKAALREREARMHFKSIYCYLKDEDAGHNSSTGNDASKELRELFSDSKKELEDLGGLEKVECQPR